MSYAKKFNTREYGSPNYSPENFDKKYFLKANNKKIELKFENEFLDEREAKKRGYDLRDGYILNGSYRYKTGVITINVYVLVSTFLFKFSTKREKFKQEIKSILLHELAHLKRYQGDWSEKIDKIKIDQRNTRFKQAVGKNFSKDTMRDIVRKNINKMSINLMGQDRDHIERIVNLGSSSGIGNYRRLSTEVDADVSFLKKIYDTTPHNERLRLNTLKDLIDYSSRDRSLPITLQKSKKYRELIMKKLATHGVVFRSSGY